MKRMTLAVMAMFLFTAPSWAQMKELTVEVDGLICPFCSYGLEKRLSKIDEIDSVSVDLARGLAAIAVMPGQVPDFHEVRETVLDSGFTPRNFNVVATGRVENWNGRLTLVVPENERFFLNDSQQRLDAVAGTAGSVTVHGVAALSPEDDDGHQHPFTITVRDIEGVE